MACIREELARRDQAAHAERVAREAKLQEVAMERNALQAALAAAQADLLAHSQATAQALYTTAWAPVWHSGWSASHPPPACRRRAPARGGSPTRYRLWSSRLPRARRAARVRWSAWHKQRQTWRAWGRRAPALGGWAAPSRACSPV